MIEDKILGSTWAEDGTDNVEASGSVTVVTECSRGERVWVKGLYDNMVMHVNTNAWGSTFTGLLFHVY